MKIASDIIYTVRTEIQPDHEEEFNEWQNTEHVPWIFRVNGYLSNRRFRNVNEPFKYMNLWEIESLAAHDSPEKMAMSKTPWGQRMLRFRKLRVCFYRQVALYQRENELSDDYELLLYVTWDAPQEKQPAVKRWIEQELFPNFFQRDRNVLGARLFYLLRGQGGNLLAIYLKKAEESSDLLLKTAYAELCKRTESTEWEVYQPMGPAIYKN